MAFSSSSNLLILCNNPVAEYIVQRQPLGGLLFLLPKMFNLENRDEMASNHQDHGKELVNNVMAELEQLLIHGNIPVSGKNISFFVLSLSMRSLFLLFISCNFHLLVCDAFIFKTQLFRY